MCIIYLQITVIKITQIMKLLLNNESVCVCVCVWKYIYNFSIKMYFIFSWMYYMHKF